MINIESVFPNLSSQPVFKNLPKLDWESFFESTSWKREGLIHESAIISDRCSIGIETQVNPFVVIEEDVIIGKNCLIRSGALIRRGTVIEDNCVIGHGAEVKHSYLFNKVKVGSHSFVGDSILGQGARIGSGVIIGNRRFDQEEIEWDAESGKLASGQDKLGCLLGNFSRLGANVSTNPGVIIGAYTWVSGGNLISESIPSKIFIKPNGQQVKNNRAKDLKSEDKEGNL